MSRKREYDSVADKQRAYRQRQKAQNDELKIILDIVRPEIETLRNQKSRGMEYCRNKNCSYVTGKNSHGVVQFAINYIAVDVLIRTGELVKVKSDWYADYYKFEEKAPDNVSEADESG